MKRRRALRLVNFDYSSPGAYFVTICAAGGARRFGEVVDDQMRQSPLGLIVERCWREIPNHILCAATDAFVVMPNHVHGILLLVGVKPVSPLPTVVGTFKAAVSRQASVGPLWQRGYYERVIRNEDELQAIRQYIADNPLKWAVDRENPLRRESPA